MNVRDRQQKNDNADRRIRFLFLEGIAMQFQVSYSFRTKITTSLLMAGLFVFMLLIPSARAQGQSQERLMTVIEAVQTALVENHEIRALQSATQAQEMDIGIARSYLLPRI
ncbi:MAG: hypothetical protein CVU51_17375, partial [Deltaproteobacteria bacterium HGW-Deltaproteobacteria-1]